MKAFSKPIIATVIAGAMALALAGCGQQAQTDATSESVPDNNRETISQVALLQSLLQGDYYGSVSIAELKTHGDTGIGTFDGLNGELIMVDGTVYRAAGDGTVEVPDDVETIPFSNVTFLDADETQALKGIASFEELEAILDARVKELGVNRFYMARIDGTFKKVNVRSEHAQSEPYQPLVDVLAVDQTFYDYEDIAGTVVALYCPDYMKELNNAGWHLHFVSEDKTKGGHVLDLAVDQAELTLDATDNFEMLLPDEEFFHDIDFMKDRSEEVRKAETNK